MVSDGIVLALATALALPAFANAFGFHGVPVSVLFAIIWLSVGADRLVSFRAGRYQPYKLDWTRPGSTGSLVFLAGLASILLVGCREWYPSWPLWTTVTLPLGCRIAGAILGLGLTLIRVKSHRRESEPDLVVPWTLVYSTAEPTLLSVSLLLMTGSVVAILALLCSVVWVCRPVTYPFVRPIALAPELDPDVSPSCVAS